MVTTRDDPVFIDSNVLVYANVIESPFHGAALEAIQRLYNQGADLWISRQVLREYLATVTRPQTFAAPQPVAVAIARVRYFQNRFLVAEDSPQVTARLLELMEQFPIGGAQVHDANIVATMQVYGIGRLLTNNGADFARFSESIAVLPLRRDET